MRTIWCKKLLQSGSQPHHNSLSLLNTAVMLYREQFPTKVTTRIHSLMFLMTICRELTQETWTHFNLLKSPPISISKHCHPLLPKKWRNSATETQVRLTSMTEIKTVFFPQQRLSVPPRSILSVGYQSRNKLVNTTGLTSSVKWNQQKREITLDKHLDRASSWAASRTKQLTSQNSTNHSPEAFNRIRTNSGFWQTAQAQDQILT